MLTSKQRAQLKALASALDTIVHVGKGGVSEAVVKQADEALTARELIKGRVLENSMLTAKEAVQMLAEACSAEPVQAIGSKFVLYRENPDMDKEKKIKLVK